MTEPAAPETKAAAPHDTPHNTPQGKAQTPPGAAAGGAGSPGGKPAGSCPPPRPKGILARLYDLLAFFPLLPLTLIYAAQTAFTLDARSLWFSDEIRHGNVYETMLATGQWLVPHLNGTPYPDKPPVYFWFLGLLDAIPGVDGPMVFQLGAAVSGLLLLWATYALARLVAGCDKRESFAAGLVLLCGFYFLGVTHYARMDLLFAAAITLAHVCMYRGLRLPVACRWIFPAFALAAVATLIKGPFGLAFPLLAGLAYALWRGMPRRWPSAAASCWPPCWPGWARYGSRATRTSSATSCATRSWTAPPPPGITSSRGGTIWPPCPPRGCRSPPCCCSCRGAGPSPPPPCAPC